MTRRALDLIRLVSRRLKSCREAAGFESARAFYESAGGHSVLRCGYATYRRLEETGRLPKPETFEKIYEELESSCDPKQLKALARAYAQALLGEDLSAWPPDAGARRASGRAGQAPTPCGLWEEISADPRTLAAVFALEGGRACPRDLPGPPPRARRALERLVRAGLARRRGDAYVPVPRAFPVERSWAPTAHAREDFQRRLYCASRGSAEVVGGSREFVHSSRDDMEEFFLHLQGQAALQVRETRRGAGRGGPVYLLEVLVHERLPLPGDE